MTEPSHNAPSTYATPPVGLDEYFDKYLLTVEGFARTHPLSNGDRMRSMQVAVTPLKDVYAPGLYFSEYCISFSKTTIEAFVKTCMRTVFMSVAIRTP